MDFLRHFDLSKKKTGWKISFFIFLVMFLLGSFQEFEAIQLTDIKPVSETGQRYLMMMLCFGLLLLYLIPFFIFIRWTTKKLHLSRLLPLISFFAGWFIPGWIAGQLNEDFQMLFNNMHLSQNAVNWLEAIQTPIVEETLKVLTVVWLLILIGKRERKDYLIAGMCAGMGFQISEDLEYIEEQIGGSHKDFMNAIPFTLDSRIENSLESHWCYTALMSLGVYYFFIQKDRKKGLLLMLAALVDHGLWDAPGTSDIGTEALIGAVLLFIFFFEYVRIMQEDTAVCLYKDTIH